MSIDSSASGYALRSLRFVEVDVASRAIAHHVLEEACSRAMLLVTRSKFGQGDDRNARPSKVRLEVVRGAQLAPLVAAHIEKEAVAAISKEMADQKLFLVLGVERTAILQDAVEVDLVAILTGSQREEPEDRQQAPRQRRSHPADARKRGIASDPVNDRIVHEHALYGGRGLANMYPPAGRRHPRARIHGGALPAGSRRERPV
jgi:hypothetical protein